MGESECGECTYLTEDPLSFAEPRRRAWERCIEAYINAGSPVAGANARVAQAADDLRTLDAFGRELARLTEARAFHDLPQVRNGRERVEGFHSLTIGPWRGIFLVDRGGTGVIAVLFSRHPHDVGARLMEVVSRYHEGKTEEGDG